MTGTDTVRELHRIIGGKDGAHGPKTLHAMALAALDDWDRDAIAWVREHGGIAYVKDAWNVRSNLKRQLDSALAKVERQQCHIEFVQRKCRERRERIEELDKAIAEMRPRLMPEGMEWLVEAWPRFEDDAPLKFGDMALIDGEVDMVEAVQLWIHGRPVIYGDNGSQKLERCERVQRPTPKVLDADGVEIRVGDDLYSVEGGLKFHVSHVDRINGKIATDAMFSLDKWADPAMYTYRAPVLAADGRPLREGETVYHIANGVAYVVREVCKHSVVVEPKCGGRRADCRVDYLTHERPDSFELIEQDVELCPHDYAQKYNKPSGMSNAKFQRTDLVRRAKALSERGQ